MSFLDHFEPGSNTLQNGLSVLLQITIVILAASLVATTPRCGGWRPRGMGSGCALGFVLLSPIVAALIDRSGFALITVPVSRHMRVSDRIEATVSPESLELEQEPFGDVRPVLSSLRDSGSLALADPSPPLDAGPSETTSTDRADHATDGLVTPVVRLSEVRPQSAKNTQTITPAWIALAGAVCWPGCWACWSPWAGWLSACDAWLRSDIHSRQSTRRRTAVLDQVRDALGASALPPIAVSHAVLGPVAAGLLYPRVILPFGLLESLTPVQLRDVLVHECPTSCGTTRSSASCSGLQPRSSGRTRWFTTSMASSRELVKRLAMTTCCARRCQRLCQHTAGIDRLLPPPRHSPRGPRPDGTDVDPQGSDLRNSGPEEEVHGSAQPVDNAGHRRRAGDGRARGRRRPAGRTDQPRSCGQPEGRCVRGPEQC